MSKLGIIKTNIKALALGYGINVSVLVRALYNTPIYIFHLFRYLSQSRRLSSSKIPSHSLCLRPCLVDFTDCAGSYGGDYVNQDLYYAQKIHKASPTVHLDIGSRFDGFITHLLSFNQHVIMGDIRELHPPEFFSLDVIPIDITSADINHKTKYKSISCLHVVEHLGLGRYGDHIDPDGFSKGIINLVNLLDPDGGLLYLSFPFGPLARTEFNSQRILSLHDSVLFLKNLRLCIHDFAYINSNGNIVVDDNPHCLLQNALDLHISGCALFTLESAP